MTKGDAAHCSAAGAFTVVIPARYQSTRLPGKPLLAIAGKPMVQHVYERALQSRATQVIVATDDRRIAEAVEGFGGRVCMTHAHHPSGTDRIHEVAVHLQLPAEAVVVNVQGDEPLIPPAVINQVAGGLFDHPRAAAATLMETTDSMAILHNPDVVKVVTDQQGYALYFSRAAIPFERDHGVDCASAYKPRRHIGVYAYRVGLLRQFVQWPVAVLEGIEKLEQLRILENGEKIHVSTAVEPVPSGIDTAEDYQRLRASL